MGLGLSGGGNLNLKELELLLTTEQLETATGSKVKSSSIPWADMSGQTVDILRYYLSPSECLHRPEQTLLSTDNRPELTQNAKAEGDMNVSAIKISNE